MLPSVQSADCTTIASAQATAAADTSVEQSVTFRISDPELPCANNSDDSKNSESELLKSSSVNEPGSQNDSGSTERVHAAISSQVGRLWKGGEAKTCI